MSAIEGRGRRILALVLVSATGCAAPSARVSERRDHPATPEENRIANLARAAKYPWTDDGACAVGAAGGEWKALVEKCYYALDVSRIQFRDLDNRCPVANINAAALGPVVGICLMTQPYLVVGAVVVIGVVVVAAAIAAELKKFPCDCVCIDTGMAGVYKHGPYPIGRRKSAYLCNHDCVERFYMGGGICR
jgi:hypothetical protein